MKAPAEGEVIYEWVSQTREVMVFRLAGKLYACSATCPHMGARLEVDFRNERLQCPWHGLQSRPADGFACDHPRFRKLRHFELREAGGEVEVEGT